MSFMWYLSIHLWTKKASNINSVQIWILNCNNILYLMFIFYYYKILFFNERLPLDHLERFILNEPCNITTFLKTKISIVFVYLKVIIHCYKKKFKNKTALELGRSFWWTLELLGGSKGVELQFGSVFFFSSFGVGGRMLV